MFKVNNKDTRTTPVVTVFIVSFELISNLVNFEQVLVGWDVHFRTEFLLRPFLGLL